MKRTWSAGWGRSKRSKLRGAATLSPENERLRAEHAYYAKRAAELEQHNRMLVESATQKELKLQEKERDLTRISAKRVAELEEHNRLLTESATAAVRKLQDIRQTDY